MRLRWSRGLLPFVLALVAGACWLVKRKEKKRKEKKRKVRYEFRIVICCLPPLSLLQLCQTKMRDYTPTVNERNLVHATSAYLELLAAAVAYVGHVGHVEEPEQGFFAWLLSPSQKEELFALRKYMAYVQTGLPGICRGALEWADVFMPTLRTALATASALHQREGDRVTVVDSFLTLPSVLGPAHVAEWEHADPTWTHVVVKTGYLLSETTLWRVCIFVNGKQIIHSI